MKKIILSISFLGLMLLNSCQKDETTSPLAISSPQETIKFQDETVLLQNGLVKEDFENYLKEITTQLSEKNLRENTDKIDWSKISSDQLYSFIGKAMKNYPDLSKDEFDDLEIEKIKKDIPSISSKADASNKKSVVSDYYNVLIKNDVEKMISTFLKKAKVSGIFGDANSFEKSLALQDPLGSYCLGNIAKAESETITNDVFSEYLPDSKKCNAFKHAAWNAIGIQELAQRSGNKWTSLERIKKLASAHEYINSPAGSSTWIIGNANENAMDLHNNLVGRTYMYQTVGTNFFGIANNIPSDTKIRDNLKVYSFTKKTGAAQILILSPSYTWSSLGDCNSAMNYHTPTAGQFVYLVD